MAARLCHKRVTLRGRVLSGVTEDARRKAEGKAPASLPVALDDRRLSAGTASCKFAVPYGEVTS